jgi:hypothetical protein
MSGALGPFDIGMAPDRKVKDLGEQQKLAWGGRHLDTRPKKFGVLRSHSSE